MLTHEQLTVLKAAILNETDAEFVAHRDSGGTGAMAEWFKVAASPAFVVWRSNYTPELMRAAILSGVTQLDGLTASKRDSLLWVVSGSLDMRTTVARAALDDLTGSQNTLKAALTNGGKRNANRGEKVLASGAGTDASPASTTFDGALNPDDIAQALAS